MILKNRKEIRSEILDTWKSTPIAPYSVLAVGVLFCDFLLLTFLWMVFGYERCGGNVLKFFKEEFHSFSFNKSLADLILANLLKVILLMITYWKLKDGTKSTLKILTTSLPTSFGIFASIKLILLLLNPLVKRSTVFVAGSSTVVGLSMLFAASEVIFALFISKEDSLILVQPRNLVEEDVEGEGEDKEKKNKRSSLKRVSTLAIPEIPVLITGICFMLCSTASTLLIPAYFGVIIKAIISTKNYETLLDALLVLGVNAAVNGFSIFLEVYSFTLAGERLGARLKNKLFSSLLTQEVSFFDNNRTGDLSNRLSSDIQVVQTALTENLDYFLSSLLTIIGGKFPFFPLFFQI